ncbi:Zinc-finger homeodomain protein 6 [Euphorbia peplus]|nr:Zinc-finger homeodomain protein 6 [Euphorbia peplus]
MDGRRQDKQAGMIPNGDSSSNCILSSFEENTRRSRDLHHHHSGRLILDPTGAPTTRSISRSPPPPLSTPPIRYRECLKNHAASMGAVVLDGCGEFMPAGEEGTPDALKCAACECHRNFHRKEIEGESQIFAAESQRTQHVNSLVPQSQPPVSHQNHRYQRGFSSSAPVMMNFGGVPAESSSEDLDMFHPSNMQGEGSMQKKRFRTKFSQEQKEKMMDFAERLEWKIQKQDDEQVHQFCLQVGVKRKIFKVWMHNNKQAMKKKQIM